MKNFLSVLALVFILNLKLAHSEDPAKGRLADGRAYRTDTQGNQLVDYIAELEMQIDGLNKRIAGLETELDSKDSQLAQVKSKSDTSLGEIKERDLGGVQKVANNNFSQPETICPKPQKLECPAQECPRTECPRLTCPATDCSSDIESVRTRLGTEINNLRVMLHSTEEQLQQKQASLATTHEALAAREQSVATLESKVAEFAGINKNLLSQIDSLTLAKNEAEDKFKDASSEIEKVKTNQSMLAEENKLLQQRMAAKEAAIQVAKVEPRAALAPTSSAKQRALDSVRGMLRTELDKLNSLIVQRNQLFSDYQSGKIEMRSGKVQVSRSELITSRGLTLTDINRQLAQQDSVGALAALRRDIGELENKVYDDISLVERLRRSTR